MLRYQSDPDRNSSKLTLCAVFAKEKKRKSKVRPKVLLGLGKSKKENKNKFLHNSVDLTFDKSGLL